MSHGRTRLPFSLVIPAFRAEKDIACAIESASSQAFVPAEIIVVDDASPDRTAEIAAAAGARVIRLARNSGPSIARNRGVAVAREPWIAFLDADDVWLDGKLAAQWDALCRWPDAGFCFTDYDVVYANGRIVQGETTADPHYQLLEGGERVGDAVRFDQARFVHALVHSMFIRQSSTVVNRDLFLRAGGFDERLRLAEDYDFFLRLSGMAPAVAVERALVIYRRQAQSLSADPLAELSAIDGLWSTILASPERYPQAAVNLVNERRHSTLLRGCILGLRLGRFAEALSFAHKAHRFDESRLSRALLVATRALDNPVGTGAYHISRSIWRMLGRLATNERGHVALQ